MWAAVRRAFFRVRALFQSDVLEAEFATEVESHIEMLAEENRARGLSAAEARRLAVLRVGGAASLREQHRDARGFRFADDLAQDLRFAFRLLMKERGFSMAAIAAIALGIGANAVGFTIVNAAFLRGFAFDHAEDLRAISWRTTAGRRSPSSFRDVEDWRSRTNGFSGVAAYSLGAINISDDANAPEQTLGAFTTANHFDVLRQKALIGRTFVAGEDQREAAPTVIIGYEIWNHRFDKDPRVLGRTLRLNGQAATIVGVMPERMKFPENAEIWAPFVPTKEQLERDARSLSVFGRLKDGVPSETAAAELDAVARQIIDADKEHAKDLAGAQVETFVSRFLGGAARPMFITVMGAVVFVLLIACANVANLLLSRGLSRSHEIAVRTSLGATRWRIVRQLLIESVVLSGVGGVIGLGLAVFGVRAFDAAVQTSQPPYWLRFTIDGRVLFYVAAICIVTGVLFGLAPALRLSRGGPHGSLKEGARGSTAQGGDGRLSAALVVVELALTVVLLCGAGLMVRSFIALYAVNPGFAAEGLSRARMQLPPAKYPTADARAAFFEALRPRIEAIPGVEGTAFATSVPPLADEERRFEIEGLVREYEEHPIVSTVTITPDYFSVLGVPMFAGRSFNDRDGSLGAESVVISRVAAARLFKDLNAVGQRVRLLPRSKDGTASPSPWRTIVGVSGPFLQGTSLEAFRSAVVYVPLRQAPPRTASLLIRSALPPENLMPAVRQAVQAIDLDQPVLSIASVAQGFKEERLIYSIFATLFAALGTIALVLSAVGVHGVMSYAVAQRRHEIGVRIAIGARPSAVAWMFLKRGLGQVAAGLAVGLPAAMALATVVRFRLVEIEPTDPVTFVAITVLLVGVAIAACLAPVRRAARVDPMVVLRSE